MKFGTGPTTIPVEGESREHSFQRMVEQVRFIKECDFDFIGLGHHYFATPTDLLHPIPAIARLAADAHPMSLNCLLLLPFFNPIDLAETLQTLDVVCNGKLIITMAQGWKDVEFKGFGINRKERTSRFIESLEILKSLWTQERTNYQGRHFTLEDVPRVGRPVQEPHPTIWIAANGDAVVKRAAVMGDGLAVSASLTLSTIKRQLQDIYWPTVHEMQKPGQVAIYRQTCISDTDQNAMRIAWPTLEATHSRMTSDTPNPNMPVEESIDLPLEQLAKERFLVGGPDTIISQLYQYQEMGIEWVNLSFPPYGGQNSQEDVNAAIRLFAKEVIPHFRNGQHS